MFKAQKYLFIIEDEIDHAGENESNEIKEIKRIVEKNARDLEDLKASLTNVDHSMKRVTKNIFKNEPDNLRSLASQFSFEVPTSKTD